MPGAYCQTVLHIHRRQFDQAFHSRGSCELCRGLISLGNFRACIHQVERFHIGKSRRERRRLRQVANKYIHAIAKHPMSFLPVACKNAWPLSALQQQLHYFRSHIAGGAANQVVHRDPHFCESVYTFAHIMRKVYSDTMSCKLALLAPENRTILSGLWEYLDKSSHLCFKLLP